MDGGIPAICKRTGEGRAARVARGRTPGGGAAGWARGSDAESRMARGAGNGDRITLWLAFPCPKPTPCTPGPLRDPGKPEAAGQPPERPSGKRWQPIPFPCGNASASPRIPPVVRFRSHERLPRTALSSCGFAAQARQNPDALLLPLLIPTENGSGAWCLHEQPSQDNAFSAATAHHPPPRSVPAPVSPCPAGKPHVGLSSAQRIARASAVVPAACPHLRKEPVPQAEARAPETDCFKRIASFSLFGGSHGPAHHRHSRAAWLRACFCQSAGTREAPHAPGTVRRRRRRPAVPDP